MIPKVKEDEIGDTRASFPAEGRAKIHLHGCFSTICKPGFTIFMAKSEYTHKKMHIQYTILLRGVYTLYIIQTGVYTVFNLSKGGIYTIEIYLPYPHQIGRILK